MQRKTIIILIKNDAEKLSYYKAALKIVQRGVQMVRKQTNFKTTR